MWNHLFDFEPHDGRPRERKGRGDVWDALTGLHLGGKERLGDMANKGRREGLCRNLELFLQLY